MKARYFFNIFVLILITLNGFVFADLKNHVVIIKPILHTKTRDTFYNIADYFHSANNEILSEIFKSYAEGGHGSGFIISDEENDFFIITNRHVVNYAETVNIQFETENGNFNTVRNCPIIYVDNDLDIAVLRFPDNQNPSKLALELSMQPLNDGDDVWSAGFPGLFGKPGWQFARGNITNKKAWIKEMVDPKITYVIQHSASIDPGNSGGPLLIRESNKGDVIYKIVGINTWSVTNRQNTFFSLPANSIKDVLMKAKEIEKLKNNAELRKSQLIENCNILTSELNSESLHWENVKDFISYSFVAENGWDSFIAVLKSSDNTMTERWEDSFFNYSPIETMRIAIYVRFLNKITMVNKTSYVQFDTINYADESNFDALDKIRTNFIINGSTTEIIWIYEFGHWRINYMNLDNEKIKRKEPKTVDAVFRTSPYLNILIPGIYQISCNDNVPGYFFITAAIGGLGMFLFSEIAFGISWSNYTDATTPGDATNYYNEASTWRTTSMIGVGVWLGTVIASTIIAVIQDSNNY